MICKLGSFLSKSSNFRETLAQPRGGKRFIDRKGKWCPENGSSSDSPASASRGAGITDMRHPTWLIFVFLVETRFHHVVQPGVKLLAFSDPPALASQSAGITGMIQHAQTISQS
ncbi:hypothetical protein AAY473_010395 [Plecturocebus cupreus]